MKPAKRRKNGGGIPTAADHIQLSCGVQIRGDAETENMVELDPLCNEVGGRLRAGIHQQLAKLTAAYLHGWAGG